LPAKDAAVIKRIEHYAALYPRFGCRRTHICLEREGFQLGWERMFRLWRHGRMRVPNKRPRRRVATSRPRSIAAIGPNEVWAYDFVLDACANGQALKCLLITDEWTHEALASDVQGSLRSRRVIEVLTRLFSEHGAPRYLRSDNGPEFVSHAVLKWLQQEGIETAHIDPGKPWQKGTAESLNGKFRDECLSMEWFRSRAEARVIMKSWRRHCNEDRPHSSLGYRTPKQFKDEQKQQSEASTQTASFN
jgi:putative transposase